MMEHDIDMDMDRELEEDNYLCKIRELEEANARLRQELKEAMNKRDEALLEKNSLSFALKECVSDFWKLVDQELETKEEQKDRERKAALTMLIIAKENILTGDESDPYLSDAEYMQLWESQKLEAKEGE